MIWLGSRLLSYHSHLRFRQRFKTRPGRAAVDVVSPVGKTVQPVRVNRVHSWTKYKWNKSILSHSSFFSYLYFLWCSFNRLMKNDILATCHFLMLLITVLWCNSVSACFLLCPVSSTAGMLFGITPNVWYYLVLLFTNTNLHTCEGGHIHTKYTLYVVPVYVYCIAFCLLMQIPHEKQSNHMSVILTTSLCERCWRFWIQLQMSLDKR